MNLIQLLKDNPDKLSADVLTTVLYKFLGTDSGMLIRRRQSFKHNSVVNEEQMV
jgi:hypothetical protein